MKDLGKRSHLSGDPDIENELSFGNGSNTVNDIAKRNNHIDLWYEENINKPPTWLDAIGNSPMHKELKRIRVELLQLGAKERTGIYKIITDARMRALREKTEAGIMIVSGHYRQKVAGFLMDKVEELRADFTKHQYKFIEEMEKKHTFAENIKNASTKRRFQESNEREEEKHFAFLESLVDKFESIVDKTLDKY